MKINVQAIFVLSLILFVVIIGFNNMIYIDELIDLYYKTTHELSNVVSYELNNMTSYNVAVGLYVVTFAYLALTVHYYIGHVYRKSNKKRVYVKR